MQTSSTIARGTRSSTGRGPNLFIVLLVIAVLFGAGYMALSSGSAVSSAATADWTVITENSGYEYLGLPVMWAATSGAGYTLLDPNSLGLPDPNSNGGCNQITKLTGAPCRWEVFQRQGQNGENIIEVHLKSGEYHVAEFQGMEVNLSSYPELQSTVFQGSTRGWLTHIGTAQWLQGLGFGRLLWEMGDKVIRAVSPSSPVHIFVDKAGWWQALSSKLPQGTPIQQVANNIWLYLMP